MSELTLYRLRKFHVPNLMSIFLSLRRISNESIQVRCPLCHFVRSLIFAVRSNPPAQPPQVEYIREIAKDRFQKINWVQITAGRCIFIISLYYFLFFNDAFNSYVSCFKRLSYWWIINRKGCGRKWLWINLRLFPDTLLKGLKKTAKNFIQDISFREETWTRSLPNIYSRKVTCSIGMWGYLHPHLLCLKYTSAWRRRRRIL
jgi:hypothetical protein